MLPGETSATASLTVYGDTIDENTLYDAEWGGLTFHSPTNADGRLRIRRRLDSALILDDDPPPTIVTTAAGVLEGDVGDTTLLVRGRGSRRASGQTVSVKWATLDSAAQPQVGSRLRARFGHAHVRPGRDVEVGPVRRARRHGRRAGPVLRQRNGAASQLSAPTNARLRHRSRWPGSASRSSSTTTESPVPGPRPARLEDITHDLEHQEPWILGVARGSSRAEGPLSWSAQRRDALGAVERRRISNLGDSSRHALRVGVPVRALGTRARCVPVITRYWWSLVVTGGDSKRTVTWGSTL